MDLTAECLEAATLRRALTGPHGHLIQIGASAPCISLRHMMKKRLCSADAGAPALSQPKTSCSLHIPSATHDPMVPLQGRVPATPSGPSV